MKYSDTDRLHVLEQIYYMYTQKYRLVMLADLINIGQLRSSTEHALVDFGADHGGVMNGRCDYVMKTRDSARDSASIPRRCEKRAGHTGAHTFGVDGPDRVVVTRVRYTAEGPQEEVVEDLA